MAGLDPAIHAFFEDGKDVDARHKAGHDDKGFIIGLNALQLPLCVAISVVRDHSNNPMKDPACPTLSTF
jgi:hypothetical protein